MAKVIKRGLGYRRLGANRFKVLRVRLCYVGAVISMVVLGLCSRIYVGQLPAFVSLHFGDALWAAMVYFGFRFFMVKNSLAIAAIASLLFSFAIEFSQLYQADWINSIRNTLPGALVLGKGFLTIDLVRYFFGILLSFLFDHYFLSRFLQAKTLGR